ncbi:hypothetical protein ACIQ7Q_25035 [Streptomyces sp. NPDC096176]
MCISCGEVAGRRREGGLEYLMMITPSACTGLTVALRMSTYRFLEAS